MVQLGEQTRLPAEDGQGQWVVGTHTSYPQPAKLPSNMNTECTTRTSTHMHTPTDMHVLTAAPQSSHAYII